MSSETTPTPSISEQKSSKWKDGLKRAVSLLSGLLGRKQQEEMSPDELVAQREKESKETVMTSYSLKDQ